MPPAAGWVRSQPGCLLTGGLDGGWQGSPMHNRMGPVLRCWLAWASAQLLPVADVREWAMPHAAGWVRLQASSAGVCGGGWNEQHTARRWVLPPAAGGLGAQHGCCRWLLGLSWSAACLLCCSAACLGCAVPSPALCRFQTTLLPLQSMQVLELCPGSPAACGNGCKLFLLLPTALQSGAFCSSLAGS